MPPQIFDRGGEQQTRDLAGDPNILASCRAKLHLVLDRGQSFTDASTCNVL